MQPWSKITHYAGFDWAHDHHEVVIVNPSGKIVADFQIEHTAEGWQRWREQASIAVVSEPPGELSLIPEPKLDSLSALSKLLDYDFDVLLLCDGQPALRGSGRKSG
jgi:hypothetical protein